MSQPKHLTQEDDIGSGERSPGQQDTDKMIEQVPPNQNSTSADRNNQTSRSKQNGSDAQAGNPP